jgi:flagellar biogenesis protein FliO
MSSYITGFAVYTLAMIGIIFVGMVIARKSLSYGPNQNKNNFLKIENCLTLEPRKNLYVIKAGREKFLIAASGDNCQLITKLEPGSHISGISEELEKIHKNNNSTEENLPIALTKKGVSSFISNYRTGIF